MRRTLSLRREPLAELATDELAAVVGAAGDAVSTVLGCPLASKVCLTRGDTCVNC